MERCHVDLSKPQMEMLMRHVGFQHSAGDKVDVNLWSSSCSPGLLPLLRSGTSSAGTHGSKSCVNEDPRVQRSTALVNSSWRRVRLTVFMQLPRLFAALKGSSMVGPMSLVIPSSRSTICNGNDKLGAARRPRRMETASLLHLKCWP